MRRRTASSVLADHFVAARISSGDERPRSIASISARAYGSPRLLRVELHGIHAMTPNGKTLMSFVRSRNDLLLDDESTDTLAMALRSAIPVAVKLYLLIEGRPRGVGVEMSTKGGKNLVDFDRSDPEVVEIVRGYLRARGVLREAAGNDLADHGVGPRNLTLAFTPSPVAREESGGEARDEAPAATLEATP